MTAETETETETVRSGSGAGAGGPLILYDLVTRPDGPLLPPNTWKARLSLLHKRVPHIVVELEVDELRKQEMREKTGMERPLVPFVELPDGTLIHDSFRIAEWLEATYPTSGPSLFAPSAAGEEAVRVDGAAFETAHRLAKIIEMGMYLASGWTPLFELSAHAIARNMLPASRAYFTSDFTSDSKLGRPNAWAEVNALDRERAVREARASLLPMAAVLEPVEGGEQPGLGLGLGGRSPPLFLASRSAPGFVDYAVFARFMMQAAVACTTTEVEEVKRVWGVEKAGGRAGWRAVGGEEKGIGGWVVRMLDLYDGAARKALDREIW